MPGGARDFFLKWIYLSNGKSVRLDIRIADAHNTEVCFEGKFDFLVKISEPTLLGRKHAGLLDTFQFLILTSDHFVSIFGIFSNIWLSGHTVQSSKN